jgi:hypothetical protein
MQDLVRYLTLQLKKEGQDKEEDTQSPWGADLPSRWGHTCLGFWFLNPRACQVHLHSIFISSYENFACCYGTIFSIPIFPLVCLEGILQELNRDDIKSTSSGCFSIMVLSNLSPRGQVCFYVTCLYYTILFIVKHIFVFCFLIKKKGIKDAEFYCSLI